MGDPPSYDHILSSPRLRQKFNIQPREDEGREILPAYSSAISLQNVFLKKQEFEGINQRAEERNWSRVFVTLQGTALTFHKYKRASLFSRLQNAHRKSSLDFPAGSKRGALIRSYNLQHADVGIAADYQKYISPPPFLFTAPNLNIY